ncbi:uncharacterized protein LOC112570626 isoform X2 [Pomacea canaliculata]|uniref:uncharacterized protein LOC112570626 isoform X2 n=1 Tax=Pomacea canaliculata TaxID=400727 RepID=UPI000D73F373|nr:uncharacterized protein LOC112570626 isoform X2 [Pomacea canaliculata]
MASSHHGCTNASCVAMATLCPMKALEIFIRVLQWKHFALVSDSEERFLEISEVLSQAYVETLLYVESSGKILMKWLESKCPTKFSHSSHSINVVVMCSRNCVTRLFQEADEFNARNKTCGVWMAGRWLVFIESAWSRDPYIWSLNTVMSNVALYFESIMEKSNFRCVRPIYTLLWRSKGRELSATAYLSVKETGEFFLSGTIFANEKYGFNGQPLVFALKKWLYYIYEDVTNGTKVWSGLYIDILDDLRERLNFSYVLKEPADGS